MTTENLLVEVEDFLNSYDLGLLPLPRDSGDDTNELSVAPAPPTEPRKRGRKKSTLDPAIKLELDRIKDRKRCSRYRQRQRDEREKLENEAAELTTELNDLQNTRQVSNELSSTTWKLIAKRELEARLCSEEQQRRLFVAVEAHAAYIRGFQELMQLPDRNKSDQEPQHKRLRVEPSDSAFCNAFVQDLDAIYARTDEVLRSCGLGDDQEDACGVWTGECNTGFFLFTNKQKMSVSFELASQKLWESGQLPHRQQDRQVFSDVEYPDNTAAFKFRFINRLATGGVVSAVQRVVTRRYQDNGRMVLVWQSLMEGEGMFTGIRAGETGWDVLTPSKDGTLIQTCISHTPMNFDVIELQKPRLKQFTGMVLESVAGDGIEIMKDFEKLQIAQV